MPESPAKMLSVADAAKTLSVDYTHVLTLIDNGSIVAVNLAANPRGKKRRLAIDPSELSAFLERRKILSAPQLSRRRRVAHVEVII